MRQQKWLMALSVLLLASLCEHKVAANIVEIQRFKLPELSLVNKYKFVFSDLDSEGDLDNAAIMFDLKFEPQKTPPNSTHQVFLIEAN